MQRIINDAGLLHVAAIHQKLPLVKYLLGQGATVNYVADISEGWNFPAKRAEILKAVEGWDPVFVRVWEKIENVIDWKLVYRPCLDKWVSDSGLIAIMGDAAHPFLPTSTQGASQAVEDGATIAMCLARAGKGNVPDQRNEE